MESRNSTNHKLAVAVMGQACKKLLRPDEGVIVHHEGGVYLVSYQSHDNNLRIEREPSFCHLEDGQRITIQDKGTTAPAPTLANIKTSATRH